MRSNLLALTILAGLVIGASASAQTSGGSTYSIFNIGDLRIDASAASAGRAGIESSVPNPNGLNSVNPAGWSDMRLVSLQAGFQFEQYKVSDAAATSYQNNSRIENFSVAIPYSETYGGTIGFSIRPLSTVAYRTLQQRVVPTSDTSTTNATLTNRGRGGISEGMLGTSYRPVEWLSVGAAASLYFGSILNETGIEFPATALNPAIYQATDTYSGFGARLGLRLHPNDALYVGAVVETGATLTRERIASSSYIDQGSAVTDTTSTTSTDITLPPRFTFGTSYQIGRSMVSGELTLQSWKTNDFSTARPSTRVAVGFDYLPSESLNAEGFERWNFRAGGFYEQTYYTVANGDVNRMGVTLGAGIPLTTFTGLNASTYMNIGTEFGVRGAITNGLTQEMFGKLYVEIGVSELWFVRAKR